MSKNIKDEIRKSAIAQFILRILSFVLSVILLRLITPDIFGLVAMIMPVVILQKVLHSFGTSNGIVSKTHIDNTELSSLFWAKLFMSLIINIIFIVSSPLIVSFYGEEKLYPLIFYFAFSSFLFSMTEIFRGIMNRKNEFYKITLIDLISFIVSGAFAIILALKGYALQALIAKEILLILTSVILLAFFSKWAPKARFKIKEVLYYFRYGLNVSIGALSSWLARSLDDILIGRKYSSDDLGVYTKSYNLLTLVPSFITGLALGFGIPIIARKKSDEEGFETYKLISRIALAINAPLGILLFFISETLVIVVFGENWSAMIPFVKLFSILAIFQVIGPLDNLIYQGRNKTSQLAKSAIIANLLIIISILLGYLLTTTTLGLAIFYAIGSILAFIPSQYILARSVSTSLLSLLNNYKYIFISILLTFSGSYILQIYAIEFQSIYKILLFSVFIPSMYFTLLYLLDRPGYKEMFTELKEYV